MKRRIILSLLFGGAFSTQGAKPFASQTGFRETTPRIVGAWRLQAVGAPILHHAICFHADGIVASFQADGGYPSDSESPGAGAYQIGSDSEVRGAFEEYRYDRATHAYLGWARIEFQITLASDGATFEGSAHSQVFDTTGNLLVDVHPTWTATRIAVAS